MFTKQEIKGNLLGCLEVFLFMPKGIDRFEVSRERMIRSFIIPVLLLPFVLTIIVGLFPEFPASLMIVLTIARTVLAAVLFLCAVYFLIKQFDRQEHFYKFLIVCNWTNINAMVLCLPILVGLSIGMDAGVFEVYAVFTEIVNYIYCAFIITFCFRIPWEMGGFISVISVAINQNLWDFSDYIRDLMVL